jgi:hypothetical protein
VAVPCLSCLEEAALLAAMPTLLPPLTAVLHSPSLHPAFTAQAAACVAALLGAARSSEDKPQLVADLAPRLLELLQWDGCPGVQLQACRAVASCAAHELRRKHHHLRRELPVPD